MKWLRAVLVATLVAAPFGVNLAYGQSQSEGAPPVRESLAADKNGDGTITILGFGDSITYGVGDGTPVGAEGNEVPFTDGTLGYLARLQTSFISQAAAASVEAPTVTTINEGRPGELLVGTGFERLPGVVANSPADVVVVMEGANDGIFQTSARLYGRRLQRAVNVIRATGRTPVLATIPTPCCDRAALSLYTSAYSNEVRNVAIINEVRYVDIEQGWNITCGSDPRGCRLLNRLEGLHPNSGGYDLIADMVSAEILGLDPLSVAQNFAQ